jgi:hypothetical protein
VLHLANKVVELKAQFDDVKATLSKAEKLVERPTHGKDGEPIVYY